MLADSMQLIKQHSPACTGWITTCAAPSLRPHPVQGQNLPPGISACEMEHTEHYKDTRAGLHEPLFIQKQEHQRCHDPGCCCSPLLHTMTTMQET